MKYQNIVSLRGDDYKRFEAVLYPETTVEDRRLGFLCGPKDIDEALLYLRMWDYGDGGDITPGEPTGPHRYQADGYVMTWDTGLSWASLDRVIDDDEDDGDDGKSGSAARFPPGNCHQGLTRIRRGIPLPGVCLSGDVRPQKGESMTEHVGYTYSGRFYCLRGCVLTAMGHAFPVYYWSTEEELFYHAQRDGMNRDNEKSFGSGIFPQRVYTSGAPGFVPQRCRGCGEWIGGIEPVGEEQAAPYWAVIATVTTRTRSRGVAWHGARQLPTFYLHESVQGILSAGQAARIARDVIDPLHQLPDDDIGIFAFKV